MAAYPCEPPRPERRADGTSSLYAEVEATSELRHRIFNAASVFGGVVVVLGCYSFRSYRAAPDCNRGGAFVMEVHCSPPRIASPAPIFLTPKAAEFRSFCAFWGAEITAARMPLMGEGYKRVTSSVYRRSVKSQRQRSAEEYASIIRK